MGTPLQPQVTTGVTALIELPLNYPTTKPALTAGELDAAFAAFYAVYPRHIAKASARKACDKAVKAGAEPAAIRAGAERFARERQGQDPKFTPYPASWLNAGRWEDEPQLGLLRAVSGGYRGPYRDPADQSAYDQEF